MKDFLVYGKCFMCKVNRFFVAKHTFKVKAISQEITSRERICPACFKVILQAQKEGKLN